MAEVRLSANKRETGGKGAARRTRAAGRVPGVVYGHGMEPLPVEVDRREYVTALHSDAGLNTLLDLEVDGQAILALTKELQRDPVRGTVLHADFVKVERDQEVEVEVGLHLVGEAVGTKEGGILEHPLNSLQVRARATEVPDAIEADVSKLKLGDTLRVSDLTEGGTFQILNDPDTVVASIVAPISEAELAGIEEAVAGGVAEAAAIQGAAAAEDAAAAGITPEEGPANPGQP